MFAYDYNCKIVLVGECSVGKTALTQRLVYDMYSERVDSTIGVDYSTKIFKMNDSSLVKLQMWDTAGQENFISLIRTYYKDVGGAIIMFDLCDRRAYNRVHFWHNELKKNASNITAPNIKLTAKKKFRTLAFRIYLIKKSLCLFKIIFLKYICSEEYK